jgi:hypothetical protein
MSTQKAQRVDGSQILLKVLKADAKNWFVNTIPAESWY